MTKISEDLIREISAKRNEPDWLLQWRLDAYNIWKNMSEPHWAEIDYAPIDYKKCDFNLYTKKYFNIDIKYFSLLRCLTEFQIAMLMSSFTKYHKVFKSCNVGSKSVPWVWCGKCAKCLFVYIIL